MEFRRVLFRSLRGAAGRLLSTVLTSGSDREWAEFDRHLCRKAAMQAYDEAGIGPSDVSVAEVHDASAFAEIIQVENLGFCEVGQVDRKSVVWGKSVSDSVDIVGVGIFKK